MKNFHANGNTIGFTAGGNINAGAGVVIGALLGVAVNDVASGTAGVAAVSGVFELPKASGFSVSPGEPLSWDGSKFVANGGILNGAAVAYAAANTAATTVLAMLCPGAGALSGGSE